MKKIILMFFLAMCLSGIASAEKNKIVMEGSTTVLPIAQLAAEEFMKDNTDINITVRGGGSGVGITSLIEKTCDIANSSRPIKESEIKKAVSNGVDPKANIIAMDGIAIIVHPSNNIKELTKKQVMDIYTGKISNWSKVGGADEKIVVISRDSASGTFEAFTALALKSAKTRPDALMNASNQAISTIVSKTPSAIGYVGLGYVTENVKALLIEGIECNTKNVLTAEYTYSRPLFMYTNGKSKGNIKKLIDFILSADGQKLVKESGFVPLKEK